MKYTLSLLLLGCMTNTFAQNIQVTEKDLSGIRIFNVLQRDHKVKDGAYTMFNYNQKVIEEGFYKDGLKDSVWTYYNFKGQVSESGKYEKGNPVGLWNVFNEGEPVLTYDYTKQTLVSYKSPLSDRPIFEVYSDTGKVMTTLQREPIYLDGPEMLSRFVGMNLRMPASAREKQLGGRVIVAFKIGVDGKMSNFRVIRPVQKDIDNEALRVLRMVPGTWLPAILDGKPVAVDYIFPVTFIYD